MCWSLRSASLPCEISLASLQKHEYIIIMPNTQWKWNGMKRKRFFTVAFRKSTFAHTKCTFPFMCWSPQKFPIHFGIQWNEIEQAFRFVLHWIYVSKRIYIYYGCADFEAIAIERKTCPTQFLLSTHTHTEISMQRAHFFLVCRVIYRELTWKSYTFVFLVSFSLLVLFLLCSYIYHSIFIQICCLWGSFSAWVWHQNHGHIRQPFIQFTQKKVCGREGEQKRSWNGIHYSSADKIVFMNFKRQNLNFLIFCCSLDAKYWIAIVFPAQTEMKGNSLVLVSNNLNRNGIWTLTAPWIAVHFRQFFLSFVALQSRI